MPEPLYHVRLTMRDDSTEGDYVFTHRDQAESFAAQQHQQRIDVMGYRIIVVRSTADATHKGPEQ